MKKKSSHLLQNQRFLIQQFIFLLIFLLLSFEKDPRALLTFIQLLPALITYFWDSKNTDSEEENNSSNDRPLQPGSLRILSSINFWQRGNYVIAFACGGALVGSVSNKFSIAIIGALIGVICGLVLPEARNSDENNNFYTKAIFSNKLFEQGKHIIALASGGAFMGGIIAQVPGSIIGAFAGSIVSLFTLEKTI